LKTPRDQSRQQAKYTFRYFSWTVLGALDLMCY